MLGLTAPPTLLAHLHGPHAVATSRVHRDSVPSTQMRCMITANRRASATIAFFIPRRLAIFIAQALSQDHFVERTNRIWGEIDAVFASFARERPDALFIAPDAFFVSRAVQFATLTARHGIPAAYSDRDNVAMGGLMSYGGRCC